MLLPDEVRHKHYEKDQRPYGMFWNELLTDARDQGDIKADLDLLLVRFLILGAVNWAIEWPAHLRQSPTLITDALVAMVFDGLVPRDH